MYASVGACKNCPTSCSSCNSSTFCLTCVNTSVLYNNFCISKCPTTSPVLINGVCTACSTQNCYSCSAADVCLICKSGFYYLKGDCVSPCPSGYISNGTNCNDIMTVSLSTSNTFPVPFSIAAAVLVIACLMSRLQFNNTYISGAVYSLLGIL
jgi:hypothetical protein